MKVNAQASGFFERNFLKRQFPGGMSAGQAETISPADQRNEMFTIGCIVLNDADSDAHNQELRNQRTSDNCFRFAD